MRYNVNSVISHNVAASDCLMDRHPALSFNKILMFFKNSVFDVLLRRQKFEKEGLFQHHELQVHIFKCIIFRAPEDISKTERSM